MQKVKETFFTSKYVYLLFISFFVFVIPLLHLKCQDMRTISEVKVGVFVIYFLFLSLLFILFALLFNTNSYLLFFCSNFLQCLQINTLVCGYFCKEWRCQTVVIKSEWLPWLSSGYLVNDYIFKRLMHIAKGAF